MNMELLKVLQSGNIISMEQLKETLLFSESKIRELLKELRKDGEKNGFMIVTVSKRGYFLQISNEVVFEKYIAKQQNSFQKNVNRKNYRVSLILFLLLQNTGYISLEQIAEIIDVSRSTVINDMEDVRRRLNRYNLKLDSKVHYGTKIVGSEKDIRQLLSIISGEIVTSDTLSLEFFDFIKDLDFTEEAEYFVALLNEYHIVISNSAIESILFHVKILIYRTMQGNYLNEIEINRTMINENLYTITKKMMLFIEEKYNLTISEEEKDLVASQIFGKASSENVSDKQKLELETSIKDVLNKLDQDFATTFSQDESLLDNLLLHIAPLIMRVSYGLTLSDSLVGFVSVQYMSAFLIALRFIDYYDALKDYELSRDEIGYLALHFATHIEKENQEKLQSIKRIAFIVDHKRSSTTLAKTKLHYIFPYANIVVVPFTAINNHSWEDVELVISTVPLKHENSLNKAILVKDPLTDKELKKLKDKVLFNSLEYTSQTIAVRNLFYSELFFAKDDGEYLNLVKEMCDQMILKGYAKEGFTDSVIERETRFSTIYENGVAAPHSLTHMANIDSIGVILLKNSTHHLGREVRCIFVLNIKKGHLLLHQEISDFIVQMMSDLNKVKLLQLSETYQNFKAFIKDYI
uniref:BglG family transcription antiterminator n=1 Tax=Candidatus Enterococcus willemsii TaxID=1857215 RepID=UPI00403F6656